MVRLYREVGWGSGGETERGVRLGEDGRVTAAETTESPPINPPRHSAVRISFPFKIKAPHQKINK